VFRVCFLLFLLLLGACGGSTSSPKEDRVLRINLFQDPLTLDPRKARDLHTITLMRMLFEGLTRVAKDGAVELALATDVKRSDDGLRYTFSLRNSYWSNGEPVTSFDFADSWKSLLDPSFPSDVAYQLYGIKNAKKVKGGEVSLDQLGISTPDAQTLIIDLETPLPYFLEIVSMSSFLPVPSNMAKLRTDWEHDPKVHVGNGPFVIQSWRRGDQIEMVKNPKYWQVSDVKISSIELLMLSPDTEMQMFQESKLDWAGSPLSLIPTETICFLKESQVLKMAPFAATYFFRVNTVAMIQGRKNPLANANFRKALALSVNRSAITEHFLQGGQTPATAIVPPEMGLSERGYFCDDSIERGRELLQEAKREMELETFAPIVVSYSSNARNAAIAQALQHQWQEGLGIPIQLEAVEPKVYFQKVSHREFQLAAGSWVADFNDPMNFLEVFKYQSASTNNTNWEHPKYIDLLNRSSVCRDSKERKELLREAEKILMEEMPIIPIYHFSMNYLKNDLLEDVVLSSMGQMDFRWAYFSDEI